MNTVVIPNIRRIINERGLKQYAVCVKPRFSLASFILYPIPIQFTSFLYLYYNSKILICKY